MNQLSKQHRSVITQSWRSESKLGFTGWTHVSRAVSFWKPWGGLFPAFSSLWEAPWFIYSLAHGPFPPFSKELRSILSHLLCLLPLLSFNSSLLSRNGSPDFMQNITVKPRPGISSEHGVFFIIVIGDRSCPNSLSSWVMGSLRSLVWGGGTGM